MSADKSSNEVAHEAEDTRANLASTLEQLRDNLRPENVMEEVVSNARIGASQVADNLVGVAKQYPIPAVLIAAGSALIMRFFAKGSKSGSAEPDTLDQDVSSGWNGRASKAVVAGTRPPMLRNPATFTPAPGRASARADMAHRPERDGLGGDPAIRRGSFGRPVGDTHVSTSSQVGDTMQTLFQSLPNDRREVKSKLSNLFEEQPLILGVIGLAVGAAIGAALPITDAEDSLMGGTAHRFRDTATDAARHEIEGLRAAAGEAVDNVRHSASENLHDFVKDVGDNAKTVVGKAGDTLNHGGQDV